MARETEKAPNGRRVERLSGTIERFTFRSADTGFAVVRFAPTDGGPSLAAVGQLAQLAEGQQVALSGIETDHPRFGLQIQVEVAEAVLPSSTAGIRAYLASSLVKGIGPATAERIVDHFGTDTLQVIEATPDRLREVKGLGEKRIDELVTAVRSQKDVQEVMVFLRAHGLGQALAARIVKRFGRNASARIQADPYRLAEDVIGVGFKTADQLARNLGIARDAPSRIQAGVQFALSRAARDGHCFLPESELCDRTAELLDVPVDVVAAQFAELELHGRIVRETSGDRDETAVFPATLATAERGCAAMLWRLCQVVAPPLVTDAGRAVEWFEAQSDTRLPAGQRTAVLNALTHPVSVITGGPGVGKTTVVRAITEILAAERRSIVLAAPTGRAAKRLEESTGHAASTIHRLLEFQPGVARFMRDPDRPIEGDALVIDEASMLDVQLAHELLRAVPARLRLVLVGDVDQLPAVGPGNVLGDLIDSGVAPVSRLTEIFRQSETSRIVGAAHSILHGEAPISGPPDGDFFVVETESANHAQRVVCALVAERIPKAFGLHPVRDVQVLCPMYRGDAGADAINRELQRTLNPTGDQLERGSRNWRVGDKVMQVRNDYNLDIFNGDAGIVRHIDRSGAILEVDFGGRLVHYPFGDLDQLTPAYAITVHRSQGSEYPAVVIPLLTEHYMMLRRNLLYTAITRGKRLVVLVGSPNAIGMAVRADEEARRFTSLAIRLRNAGRD